MDTKFKVALGLMASVVVIMHLNGCMYSRGERQSDDEHYKHETRISDRAVLDRNAR